MRILVVDDHEVVRRGICSVLAAEPSLTICGEAVDGLDALEKAKALRPDVVVMDISMPNMNGLDATREIKKLLPTSAVVIVSQHDAPEMVRQALSAGANGYVTKSAISKDLLLAIAKVNDEVAFVKGATLPSSPDSLNPEAILKRSSQVEKALRDSEERFRSAMNNLAEGLYIIDMQGLVTYVNPSAEEMLGWTSAELIGRKIHQVAHYKHPDGTPFPSDDCPSLQVLQTGEPIREHQDTFIRKDGSFFPVVFSSSPLISDTAPVGLVVSFRDDTNRRQTEENLRQSEMIYRRIGESIDYGVWMCDPSGRNIYASPSFLQMVGLTQQQCSEFGWAHVLHPEDAEETVTAWKESVRTGSFWEREHRFRGVDGGWHHVLARGGPIRDEQGKILYWAGINLDIQRHKETQRELELVVHTLEARIAERTQELEKANDKLRELSGKLLQIQDEERRRIARELHDGVGQLLAALNMNLSNLTSERTRLSPEGSRSLDENVNLVEQASQEIRTMSHLLHPPLLDEVGLESALSWYVDGFAERSKITVKMDLVAGFSKGLPRDLALALFRIFQECLTNVHRHSGSATAVVQITRKSNEIVLEVRDDGRGISSDLQCKISSGESSGVGLRGIRERVRQFGGRLDITSDPDGTQIVAVLPLPKFDSDIQDAKNESPDRAMLQGTSEDASAGTATILCIDDEAAGLLPRKLLLESFGYRVLEARSGPEGIQLFQSEKVDAVILDYWMSGMKGTAVASELKRINSAVPIIVLSGVSDLPGEAAGLVDQWLVKGSQRAEQLLESISTLLERKPV